MIPSFPHLELLRDGVAEIPEAGSNFAAVPVLVEHGERKPLRVCSCSDHKKNCEHLKSLGRSVAELRKHLDGERWEDLFTQSRWYRLARLLFESNPATREDVDVAQLGDGPGAALLWSTESRGELARVFADGALRVRLLERLGRAPEGNGFIDRAAVLTRLAGFQRSRAEREMNKRGMETTRQSWESSFWHGLAYHWVRELGPECGVFEPAVNRESGAFTLSFEHQGEVLCRIVLPRRRVEQALRLLAPAAGVPSGLTPQPLACSFPDQGGDGGPLLDMLRTPGDKLLADVNDRFRYGKLVYLPELEVLTRPQHAPGSDAAGDSSSESTSSESASSDLQSSDAPPSDAPPSDATPSDMPPSDASPAIPLPSPERGRVVGFFDPSIVVHEELVVHHPPPQRRVHTAPEALELHVEAMEHGRWWVSLHLAFDQETVPLGDLWHARHHLEESRFNLGRGEIDLDAVLGSCEPLLRDRDPEDDHLLLSAVDLLRWRGADVASMRVRGRKTRAGVVRKLFDLRPTEPFIVAPGFAAELSPEEMYLTEWMSFLWEHRLGGVACELREGGGLLPVLALLLNIHEPTSIRGPSGTSLVIGEDHDTWKEVVGAITPQLRAAVYDPEIDLDTLLLENDVLLLDYATLRRDLALLRGQGFALVVCDGVLKLERLGHRFEHAISQLKARVKIGLCDEALGEEPRRLKRFVDLMAPGYLGSDDRFLERYGSRRRVELRRMVEPFVQSPRKRRLKRS